MEEINPLVERFAPTKGGRKQKYFLDDYARQLIVSAYDSTSVSVNTLAEKLKVPPQTISKWAHKLGVSRHAHQRWTEKEVAYLKRYYYEKSPERIAAHLGRTVGSIHLKARRMELTESPGYTNADIRMGLGVGKRAMDKWIKSGWLKGEKKGDASSDRWEFTEKAIREFIFAHPEEINPRLMDWLWVVDILAGDMGIGRLDIDKYTERGRQNAHNKPNL